MFLKNKRIILGVCGGIAAYKSAELTRRLREQGAQVRVVMTDTAMEFITPMTMQALSGNPVAHALMDEQAELAMGHIELARWADEIVIAPATANFMARLAQGMADDLLSTLCLATEAPVLLAPAMNRVMWENAATQANAATLQSRGYRLLGPAEGLQACGEKGVGRMLEVDDLCHAVNESFRGDELSGKTVLVSAGPTREAMDPVRYISNQSSGKMGFSVAQAAAEAGANVILVAGPVKLATPDRIQRVDVVSANDMHRAVQAYAANSDIFISAAAVADYRPVQIHDQKQKKAASKMTFEVERTTDILADVARLENAPFTVGFAAETQDLEHYAQSKRRAKSIDMIAANIVGGETGGFNRDDNALTVYWEGGQQALSLAPKPRLAKQLIALVATQYFARSVA